MTRGDEDNQTVFVVDDDEAVRDSLGALLESVGFEVESFGSGADFLDFLDRLDPKRGGCIVLDVRMPGLGGLEIQEKLAEKRIALPVIIITGHGDVPIAVQAIKAGAIDFIEKPFGDDVILESVGRALEQGRRNKRDASSAAEIEARLARLTPRERDVLEQLVIGNPNKIIAYELAISPRTVEIHRARVIEKMEARSLSHLVRLALTVGVIPEDSEA